MYHTGHWLRGLWLDKHKPDGHNLSSHSGCSQAVLLTSQAVLPVLLNRMSNTHTCRMCEKMCTALPSCR